MSVLSHELKIDLVQNKECPHCKIQFVHGASLAQIKAARCRSAARNNRSQQFVLPEVHSLDDVPAIVENAPYVLGVDGTREMRIAVVPSVGNCDFQKLVSKEIFCSDKFWIFAVVRVGIRCVSFEFWKVVFDL